MSFIKKIERINKSDRLVQSPVKTDRNIEVRNFLIHGAKIQFYFGFRMWDFGFFFDFGFRRWDFGFF